MGGEMKVKDVDEVMASLPYENNMLTRLRK